MHRPKRRISLLLALAALPAPALAQSNAEINAGVQFNFSPPGARSLALGGAFTALADDATAAYTNPAGLGVLTRPEVSLEARGAEFTSLYTEGGNAAAPTGRGIDTVAGLVEGERSDSTRGPSFASVVFPRGRMAVALYRHELARYRASAETQGAYVHSNLRAFPARSDLSLDIVNYGASVAYRIRDTLSVGAGVSFFDFTLDSLTERFAINRRDAVVNDTRVGAFFGPPDFSAGNLTNFQIQSGEDAALGFSTGLIWKPTPSLQVGGTFRKGPDFGGVSIENRPGPRGSFAPTIGQSGFKVPDAYSAGIVWRATDRFVVAIDWVRILHSQRLDHFVDVFGGAGQADPADYRVDDGDEIRAGAEYVFAGMKRPLALRVGGWLEPDSRVRWVGSPTISDVSRILFREGSREAHVTGGFGWVLGSRFQVDGAADVSKRSSIASLSAVMRF